LKQALTQFTRYAIVGLASNAFGYLLYLGLTHLGMGPKLAMTLLYGVGVLQTFVFNKKWSFRFDGAATPALIRYAVAYAFGYVVNLLALVLFVDQAKLPHELVQGVMILVVAVMLFLAQRYWVFPQASRSDAL
jgi:putative flippase GtrA